MYYLLHQRLEHPLSERYDVYHHQLNKTRARQIYDDFTRLYPTLLTFYNQTIDTLKCADAIKQLRQEHYEATGTMAHEPEPTSTIITTASGFWEKLNLMLIY